MLSHFENQYNLKGRLITETGLHIGRGGNLVVAASDNPVIKDSRGWPYIPGSSFKGALRSRVEAMVRALSKENERGIWSCDPLEEPCVDAKKMREWRDAQKSGKELADLVQESSCTICRLFGSPWLASRVKISDLYLNPTNKPNRGEATIESERWFGRIEVRAGVAINRDTETAEDKRLYDYEVVPGETSFFLNIRVDNCSDEELGLLMLGLREFERGMAWIGGIRSRGLGRVKIVWDEIEEVRGREGLIQYLKNGYGTRLTGREAINRFVQEKIRNFLSTLGEKSEVNHAEETAQSS